MFEQAVQTSDAMRQAAQQRKGVLIPALSGCPACQTTHMIAAPVLGFCEDCGTELTVLSSPETQRLD
jgi:hypothetical protein